MPLPDAVMQGLGWAPPPVDSSLQGGPGPVAPPAIGPTLPFQAQPPGAEMPAPGPLPGPPVTSPAPSLDLPPQDASRVLPSSREQPPAPEVAAPQPDVHMPPPPAGLTPPPAPPKPRPLAPQTPEQGFAAQRQQQSAADQQGMTAIAAQEAVSRQKGAEDLAAHEAYNARAKEIEAQRKAEQDEYTRVHAVKQQYVDNALKEVDNYKVDQNKYMKELGLGHEVGWYIAMALSGIGAAMQGKGGEPNPVIAMLQKKMHDSVVAQMDQRDQLEKKYGRAEHALDRYDAWSKDRQAQTALLDARNDKMLSNAIATAAAKYEDPQAQATAQSEAARLLQSSADKGLAATSAAASYDMQKRQAGIAAGHLSLATQQFRAEYGPGGFKEQELELKGAGLMNERDKLLMKGKEDRDKLIRERALGGEVKEIKDKDGKVVGSELGLLTDKKGDVWIPQGPEPAVNKLHEQHNVVLQLLSTMDEMNRLGPEWLSNTANSDKKQKLDQLFGTAKLQAIKANNLGVPTGRDVELALGTLGTTDPTRFRDSLAGLREARKTLIRNHNVELHTAGYDKDWNPPDLTNAPPAAPTAVQKLATVLKAEPDQNPSRVRDKAFNEAWRANGGNMAASLQAGVDAEAAVRRGDLGPDQKQAIANLEAIAKAGGADGSEALAALQDIVNGQDSSYRDKPKSAAEAAIARFQKTSPSPIRAAAQAALDRLTAPPPAPAPPITSAGPTYDPNGYDPESLVRRFHAPVQRTLTP